MRVILLKDVRHCGTAGEVKEVANGYAQNFLFPRKLAEPATEEKVRALEVQREARAAEAARAEESLAALVRSLEGKEVVLSLRATEKGGLFKAVSVSDVSRAIHEQLNAEISEDAIVLSQPIKTTGEHTVEVRSKTARVKLSVTIQAT